jgi:hypothetical protein
MAAKLLTNTIAAPGFQGLNTQESSVTLESGFATTAENCVIDKFGRIGARKGWLPKHSTLGALGSAEVKSIGQLITEDGTTYTVAAGNNKLFKLVGSTLSELTYGGGGVAPGISDSHWQMCSLNNILYLYQSGHDPLIFDPTVSAGTYRRVSEKSGYLGTVQSAASVISAYGRTWSAATTTDKSLIQFSDLLLGFVLSTGSSGVLDITQIWPHGSDEITALAAHNGFLIVFGKRQILIYNNPQDPAAMSLQDAITGVGCIARDSVVNTGTDVIFLSDNGVRSLMRVIQEKSSPMRDLSSNIRDDLVSTIAGAVPATIKAAYSEKEAFYLLSFSDSSLTYCFDMRTMLQNGAARATSWTLNPTAFCYTKDKELLMGFAGYIGYHTGYLDNTSTYNMRYFTNYFDFGAPTVVKILKKVGVVTVGGQGYTVSLNIGYDFTDNYTYRSFSIPAGVPSEYGVAEYGIAEFTPSSLNSIAVNVGGQGKVIQLGLETVVNTNAISIQKLDIYVKTGKTA